MVFWKADLCLLKNAWWFLEIIGNDAWWFPEKIICLAPGIMMQLLDNLKLELIGVTLLRQPNCPHCQRGLEPNRQQAEYIIR